MKQKPEVKVFILVQAALECCFSLFSFLQNDVNYIKALVTK